MQYLNTEDGGIVNEECEVIVTFKHDGFTWCNVVWGDMSTPRCVRANCVTKHKVSDHAIYTIDDGWIE